MTAKESVAADGVGFGAAAVAGRAMASFGPEPPGSPRTRLRSRRRWSLALAVSIALVACQNEDAKIAEFRESGRTYVENEQWDEAIIQYRNVLKLAPNDASAHFELAKAYLEVQKVREAYWEYHEAQRLDPENVEARMAYGQLSLAAQDFEEALAQADACIALAPQSDEAHVLRGHALMGQERPDEAEEAYLKARELDPDEPAHLFILASHYQRYEQPEKAEELLLDLTQRDPGFASYTALGRFLARDRARSLDAENAFRRALELAEPDRVTAAYRNLAGFYYGLERFSEAVLVLEEGIQKAEDRLDLIYLLARFHRSRGDLEKADSLVEDATRERPDDPGPFLVLSMYRGQQGDFDGALAAAESALKAAPGDKRARLRKAELLVDMGYREKDKVRVAKGRSIVEAVLASEPSDPAALFVRSKIELAEGDSERAVQSLRVAIEGRPDWAQAHFVLGSTLLLRGDLQGARTELARTIELDPGLLEARRVLSQVHARLNEYEYAIEQGRLYLRDRPDSASVRILVAQSLVRLGRIDDAVAELNAIPEDRRTADVYYALGRLHASAGDLEEARTLLIRAADEEPTNPDILRALLGVEGRLGQPESSVARIEAALRAEPDSPGLLQLAGLLAMMSRDFDRAEASFKRAVDLEPDSLESYEQLAAFYRATGQLEKTLSTYEAAVEARPENARLRHFLGILYEMSGDSTRAIESYSAAIERDPSLAESMNNLAYLLAESDRDLGRALDLAQEAKLLLPESANAADTLGWVLYKRGRPSAAVGYLREAEAGMDPNDDSLGVVRHHLALAYEANGESDKAVATLERALETLGKQQKAAREAGREPRDPSWLPEVRAMLDRLESATG